jgi:hypothetical protein
MSPDGLRPSPPLLRFTLHPSSDLETCWCDQYDVCSVFDRMNHN